MDSTVSQSIVVDGRNYWEKKTSIMGNGEMGVQNSIRQNSVGMCGAIVGHKTNNMIWVCLKLYYPKIANRR